MVSPPPPTVKRRVRPSGSVTAIVVLGVEVDDEAIWHDRAFEGHPPTRLHGPLDAALHLKGLQPRPEEPGRRAFEEAFEEPLDGGQGRHGRWRSLAEGPGRPGGERL